MRKKMLFILLFGVIFAVSTPMVYAAECVNYKNGNGTENNPYQITTNEELYSINCHLNSHFILMNNLDLTNDTSASNGKFYNNGAGWLSIGNDREDFTGVFNGNNKTITGLTQNKAFNISTGDILYSDYGGLFRVVSGTVKNVYLENIKISFSESVNVGVGIGGIAAYSRGSIINSKVSGTITFTGTTGYLPAFIPHSIGGIVGYVEKGDIKNNINEANITATSDLDGTLGGIVGDMSTGNIDSCINKGNISTNGQDAGGITDRLGEGTLVSNCKNYGTITADYSGGIAATVADGKVVLSANYGTIDARLMGGGIASSSIMDSIIEKSYNAGTVNTFESVTQGTPGAGGIVGVSYATIKDCYNLGTVNDLKGINSRKPSIGGIAGVATGTVTNTYNIGTVNSTNEETIIGSLVGINNSDLTNSYYFGDEIPGVGVQNPKDYTDKGEDNSTKLTLDQLKIKSSYIGFDFENVWNTNKNETYSLPQINNNDLEGTYLKSINLEYNEKVYIGKKIKINYEMVPNDTLYEDIIWTVENGTGEGTITQDGEFTGTKTGTVTVIATSKNFPIVAGKIEIDILPIPIETIKINESIRQVSLNNPYNFTTTVTPSNTTNKNVTWSVENGTGEGTITEAGKFTGTRTGTVTIVATSQDNSAKSDRIELEIVEIDVQSIKIKAASNYVNTGSSFYLSAYISPTNASTKDVVWSSSDTSIASINLTTGGVATKNKTGQVTITATSTIDPEIKDSITLFVGYTSIKLNEITRIGSNSYVTYKDVIWEIKDESILKPTGSTGYTALNNLYRHNIEVQGLKNGSTTVTMKTIAGDVLAKSTVYVYTPILTITSDIKELNLEKNETKKLNITITPDNVSSGLDTLIYTSSDDSIVSVDQAGNVTAKKNGSASITVYSQFNNASLTIPVKVVTSATGLELDSYNVNLTKENASHQIIYDVLPSDSSFKKVNFSSSNPNVATVSENGLITAKELGTATITASLVGTDIRASIKVTVTKYLKGDLDRSGTISISDVVEALFRIVDKVPTTDEDIQIGDLDGDGKITISDAVAIIWLFINQ